MARALLGWTMGDLAQKIGISPNTLHNIEARKTISPRGDTLTKIQQVFEERGIEFIEGGLRKKNDILTVIEGDDEYIKLLDDVYHTLTAGEEVLFLGSDERRSTPAVNESLRRIRKAGIKMRSIIDEGNEYILGPLEEYRCAKGTYSHEVIVIYGEKVAFFSHSYGQSRVIVIKDLDIYKGLKGAFEFLWNNSEAPKNTVVDEQY